MSDAADIPEVYLNGAFMPLDQARVPVMDRGFLFGDGVYEVIPCYGRRPFRLADHLRRLRHSLEGIRLESVSPRPANPVPPPPEGAKSFLGLPGERLERPLDDAAWGALIERIAARSPWPDCGVYLQVTRGPGPREHAFPAAPRPTVFLMPLALNAPPQELFARGVAAITAPDNRWLRCDLKATSLLANVLLRQASVDAGCAETLLLRDGFLTEGSASSVFIVRDGQLLAPPESTLMLPGITYEVVLELARAQSLPCATRAITEAELRTADEVWITSSTKEVLAVTRLDGAPVGDGTPGPVYARMRAAYQAYKQAVMRGEAT